MLTLAVNVLVSKMTYDVGVRKHL